MVAKMTAPEKVHEASRIANVSAITLMSVVWERHNTKPSKIAIYLQVLNLRCVRSVVYASRMLASVARIGER
jgi:hypothetical protein